MPTPVTGLIYGALAEIRVARGGDVVRAEDQALCLTFLNEVLERLAVTPHAVYALGSGTLPLTPGLNPHTIGPTGTCVLPVRPVRIPRAQLLLPPTGLTLIPPKSSAWFQEQTLPTLTSAVPEGFWYNPTWPNGQIWFWPLPAQAATVQFEVEIAITAVVDTDTIDLPQGYSELLRLWTAKKAAPSFAREFSTASQAALTECLGEIFGTNIGRVTDLDTRDGGMPGGRGGVYDSRTGAVT